MRKYLVLLVCVGVAGCVEKDADHLDGMSRGILTGPAVAQQTPAQQQGPAGSGTVRPPVGGSYSGGQRGWAPAAKAWRWKYIVVHHSDTKVGSAASFDRYHREVRHWDELGYHFVIGNGTGSADGQVEVGPRWTKQKIGAHAGVREFNEYGIGICLVGDFQTDRPSSAQMRSLGQLVAYLERTYRIPESRVMGHGQIPGKSTNCPGRNLNIATVRAMARQMASVEGMGWVEMACGGW